MSELGLLDFPTEIFYHIVEFLDPVSICNLYVSLRSEGWVLEDFVDDIFDLSLKDDIYRTKDLKTVTPYTNEEAEMLVSEWAEIKNNRYRQTIDDIKSVATYDASPGVWPNFPKSWLAVKTDVLVDRRVNRENKAPRIKINHITPVTLEDMMQQYYQFSNKSSVWEYQKEIFDIQNTQRAVTEVNYTTYGIDGSSTNVELKYHNFYRDYPYHFQCPKSVMEILSIGETGIPVKWTGERKRDPYYLMYYDPLMDPNEYGGVVELFEEHNDELDCKMIAALAD
jgi:hypothetical protein